MSENQLWNTMRQQMGANKYWREATRHEDALQKGIADVSYISTLGQHGWIELKQVNEWPKRESTILRIDHYSDDQRMWLKRKGKAGAFTWLFVKVQRDYMLFDWLQAQHVGKLPKDHLKRAAFGLWENKMNWHDLGVRLCKETRYQP
jgi:hypothetical protein